MREDKFYNIFGGCPWLKDFRNASQLQGANILVRNYPSNQEQNIARTFSPQQFADAWNYGVVSAGKDRDADGVNVLLNSCAGDLLGSLPQAGIDDFHSRIAQSSSHNFGPAVVAIQAGLCHEDS